MIPVFNSIPGEFAMVDDSESNNTNGKGVYLLSIHGGTHPKGTKIIQGSYVTHPSKIGNLGLVTCVSGHIVAYDGKKHPSQRIMISHFSNNKPHSLMTMIFSRHPVTKKGAMEKSPSNCLYLHIVPRLIGANVLTHAEGHCQVALGVGPSSLSILSIKSHGTLNSNEMELGSIWSDLFDVAKKVVPVAAKAGYQIYNELSNQQQLSGSTEEEELGDIFSTIGSIAQVAVPILGCLL